MNLDLFQLPLWSLTSPRVQTENGLPLHARTSLPEVDGEGVLRSASTTAGWSRAERPRPLSQPLRWPPNPQRQAPSRTGVGNRLPEALASSSCNLMETGAQPGEHKLRQRSATARTTLRSLPLQIPLTHVPLQVYGLGLKRSFY